MGVAMDVTDQERQHRDRRDRQAYGGVDILVSNAGIQIVNPIEEFLLRQMEEDAGDPPRWRLPHDEGGLKYMYRDNRAP